MRTRVKDFIEVSDYTSLDRLITTLTAIRDSLPEGADLPGLLSELAGSEARDRDCTISARASISSGAVFNEFVRES